MQAQHKIMNWLKTVWGFFPFFFKFDYTIDCEFYCIVTMLDLLQNGVVETLIIGLSEQKKKI